MRLRLSNVLSRYGGKASENQYAKTLGMFDSYLRTKNLTRYGPVIICNTPEGNDVGITIMVQIRESPASVDAPFEFAPEVVVENCIMVRYEGPENSTLMAQSKAAVYAFENDMKLSGRQYTVIKERSDGMVSMDLFMEVLPE